MEDDQIIIDMNSLRRVMHRNGGKYAWRCLIFAIVTLLIASLTIPQSYTAKSSVAIQQAASMSSGISLLTGQSGNRRYIGVLKSRTAAMYVESVVHLQQMYNLKNSEDAYEMLIKCAAPEDNASEGLLNINVTLPGPPKLSLASARRAKVKETAALAANTYVDYLKNWYLNNDNDRETILVKAADEELLKARTNYNSAIANLKDYAGKLGRVDPRATPALDTNSPSPSVVVIARLYEELSGVETELKSKEASLNAEQAMVTGQLNNIANLPAEDPLLANARQAVDDDKANLEALLVQFGNGHPAVVRARAQLAIDERRLKQQAAGISGKKTTRQIRYESEIQGLKARQADIKRQIADAEGHLKVNRRLTADYATLKAEVEFAIEGLKTVISESERVHMQNVSANSRLTVVDQAVEPQTGFPGTVILAVVSIFLGIVLFFIMVVRGYLKEAPVIHTGIEQHKLEITKQ